MDGAVMEGPLFLQSQRFGTKRWRKTWAVLYPASPHGVARLEFFDHKGPSSGGGRGGSRRLDCKVIRLAECVSVAPVAVESPPEPGAAAFRLDTAQRSHLLAADAPSSVAWVQTLCRNAFPKGSWALAPAENPPKLSALEMLENSLYSPAWEGSQFWVTAQRTEAAERCGLHGSYVLRVEAEKLTLLAVAAQSQILEPLLSWPYTLLRRYGRDKVMFSFEAGRRCPSGPGTFTFQTAQGNDIFQAVENAIHRQKAQGKAVQGQDVLRADSHEGEVAEGTLASPPGPQELPGNPPAVYAEPLDSLRVPPRPSRDSLYSDPLDSTPARAGEGAQLKKPLYWDLYEHVQQQLLKTKGTKGVKGKICPTKSWMEVGQVAGPRGWDLGEASTSKSSPPKEGIAGGPSLWKGVFGLSRCSLRGLDGLQGDTGLCLDPSPCVVLCQRYIFKKVLFSLKLVWV
uniref:Docking protein 1 n=1 Tax=Sus scrofa TaxID=9823 RepID=A0A8D0PPW9_PIG